MKKKHILALLLSLLMVLTMSMTAFAAGDGTLTVNGAVKGNTYTLYKVFDLESYTPGDGNGNGASYSYTIKGDSPFYHCVSTMTSDVRGRDVNVFDLKPKPGTTNVYYVSLNPTLGTVSNDSQPIKDIAAKLLNCIKTNNIPFTKQIDKIGVTGQEQKLPTGANITYVTDATDTSKYNISFNDLELGYYLLDSSVSTVVGLTTTKPDAAINVKDVLPAVDKKAERHVDGTWSDEGNSKAIGEIATFRTAVTVEAGAKNYILYDKMEPGLKFDRITQIYYGSDNSLKRTNVYNVIDTLAEMETTVTETENGKDIADNTGKTIISIQTKNAQHNGTPVAFMIKFDDDFLKTVYENGSTTGGLDHNIYIEYEAYVTKDAAIWSGNGESNKNETWLTYGDNNVELYDFTKTYVYKFDVVKTDGDKVLQGAKFELYENYNCTELVPLVKEPNTSNPTIYRVASEEEREATGFESAVIEAGYVRISGVGAAFGDDGRVYYLKEVEAPAGYNMLSAPKEVKILGNDPLVATIDAGVYKTGGIEVENKQGSLLPSTGGIGTTIFYVLGGILILGAMVLLITKRRMKAEK